MITSLEAKGKLIHECGLPRETRADGVFPAHPNGIPLSKDRWLLIYATRGWRCADDDMSIVYQIREHTPVGPVLKEGMLRQALTDWDPFEDGSAVVRQLGSPEAFGVPKGAMIQGKPAVNANVFVAKWRIVAPGVFDKRSGLVRRGFGWLKSHTQNIEWAQFRLNDKEDDIEILQEPRYLRQKGYEEGDPFCSEERARIMNQAIQAVPFSDDGTEWVDVNTFFDGRTTPLYSNSWVAALKYRFNSERKLYEWVETGPLMENETWSLSGASIAPTDDGWIIAMQSKRKSGGGAGICWVRTNNPFAEKPLPVFKADPPVDSPLTLYRCADGIHRLFGGDRHASPYGLARAPLYSWDIDPKTLEASNRRVICDVVKRGILPEETSATTDICKLLPHGGGSKQYLLWRVRTGNLGFVYKNLPPVTEEWKEKHGIYWAEISYEESLAGAWKYDE